MPSGDRIPFIDLVTPHQELAIELVAVFEKALSTGGFIGGPMVEEFEKAFAAYCQAVECVGLASGTDAVRFALMAAGVKAGDVVVTVPHTFIATTEAVSQAGARPDFVDIDERTYCMNPLELRRYLDEKCRWDESQNRAFLKDSGAPVTAVVPVHIYGQTADMDAILEIARTYNLIVVEDACQAHGAEYFSRRDNRWHQAGSMGQAAAFSFYPGKNLGACGEAGAVTTNDPELAKMIRKLRDHGQARKYYHDVEGYNGRLDAIQAGLLSVKLKHLPMWTKQRADLASRYDELFKSLSADVIAPYKPEWAHAVYHLYVIRVRHREALKTHLAKAGIDSGIHYPIPLHLQKAYEFLGYKEGAFPVAEQSASEILSLPMYPQLTHEFQDRVVQEVIKYMSEGAITNEVTPMISATTP